MSEEVIKKKVFGSRDKGNRLERDVAKQLSEWWGEEKSFRRTPLSGGWDKRACGDLIVPERFPFTPELKNCEGWELHQLLTSDKSMLDRHWAQAVGEVGAGKKPLLIFTRNHQPVFYMMFSRDFNWLNRVKDEKKCFVFLNGDKMEDAKVIGLFDELLSEWICPK